MLHNVDLFRSKALAIWVTVEILFPSNVTNSSRPAICCPYVLESDEEEQTQCRVPAGKIEYSLRTHILVHEIDGVDVADWT